MIRVPLSTQPLLESFIISLLASLLIHVLLVLLGAPFVLKLPHTFALAVLLSLLAVWPTAYTIGWNEGREKATWVRMYSAFESVAFVLSLVGKTEHRSFLRPRNDLEVAMFAPAVGTVLGCWTGAFPIPLDWDRPWQVRPENSYSRSFLDSMSDVSARRTSGLADHLRRWRCRGTYPRLGRRDGLDRGPERASRREGKGGGKPSDFAAGQVGCKEIDSSMRALFTPGGQLDRWQ